MFFPPTGPVELLYYYLGLDWTVGFFLFSEPVFWFDLFSSTPTALAIRFMMELVWCCQTIRNSSLHPIHGVHSLFLNALAEVHCQKTLLFSVHP